MNYEQITREQVASYLDVAPTSQTMDLSIIGVGVTDYGISFNPQVNQEKWIIRKNATPNLESFQLQGDISQSCHKGDDVFEYVNELRRTLKIGSEVKSHIVDVDIWDEVSAGVFKATKYDCIVVVTKWMSATATIEYSIYYDGDPVLGTVSFDGEGKATFTETPLSL